MDKKIIITRSILWLMLVLILLVLLRLAVVPSGKISYMNDFIKPYYFISKLTPEERVKVKEGAVEIKGDPVYFTLRTPRKFDKATLTVKFKNQTDLPIIEAGVLVDKNLWRYQTLPLQNRLLDDLINEWDYVDESGTILLQKSKKYDSISEFLNNPPSSDQIATYNYDLNNKFFISDYQSDLRDKTIDQAIRGSYQFYTYIKNETLDYTFYFIDLNHNKEGDQVEIKVYDDNKNLISSKFLSDDGVTDDFGIPSPKRELSVKLPGLSEGVYKIELVVNDDIVTDHIITKQQKISFINKLWLADKNLGSLNLYTDSNLINAQTANPSSLQDILINDGKLQLEETYHQYNIEAGEKINAIKIKKSDLIISGNGIFSFSIDQLIEPKIKKLDYSFDPDKSSINYIIAKYKSPDDTGDGWKRAVAIFDISNAYREDGKNSFLISIPGLTTENQNKISVGDIKIDLSGDTIWHKLNNIISKYFK